MGDLSAAAARKAERARAKSIEKNADSGIMPDIDGYAEQEGYEPVIPEKYRNDSPILSR